MNTFMRIENDIAAKTLAKSRYNGLLPLFGIYQRRMSQPTAVNAAVRVN